MLEMLQATCSAKGKWSIKAAHAAHKQQGGGMSLGSFYLAAGRLRDTQVRTLYINVLPIQLPVSGTPVRNASLRAEVQLKHAVEGRDVTDLRLPIF